MLVTSIFFFSHNNLSPITDMGHHLWRTLILPNDKILDKTNLNTFKDKN